MVGYHLIGQRLNVRLGWKSCCTMLYSLLLHGNLDFLLASLSVSYMLLGSCLWTRNQSWWDHLFYLCLLFFFIPGPQTQSRGTCLSFMQLSKPISSFGSWLYAGQKQGHFPSSRICCMNEFGRYLPFILLLDISFSYHLLERFSLCNNCFHHLYHHQGKIVYRDRDFLALTIYFTPTCLWTCSSTYILSSSWIQK